MYLPRKFWERGLKSLEEEYKLTKIKVAVKLYSNSWCRWYEENTDGSGPQALIKDAKKYAQELGLELHLI